jgi:hypothetical protein
MRAALHPPPAGLQAVSFRRLAFGTARLHIGRVHGGA